MVEKSLVFFNIYFKKMSSIYTNSTNHARFMFRLTEKSKDAVNNPISTKVLSEKYTEPYCLRFQQGNKAKDLL